MQINCFKAIAWPMGTYCFFSEKELFVLQLAKHTEFIDYAGPNPVKYTHTRSSVELRSLVFVFFLNHSDYQSSTYSMLKASFKNQTV